MNKVWKIVAMGLLIVLTAGLLYVAFCGLGETQYGSATTIKQGLDLAGGVSITVSLPMLHWVKP